MQCHRALLPAGAQRRHRGQRQAAPVGLSGPGRGTHRDHVATKRGTGRSQPASSSPGQRNTSHPELPEETGAERRRRGRVRLCGSEPLRHAGQPQGQGPAGL